MTAVFTQSTPDVSVRSFLASRGFKVRSQCSSRQTVLPRREQWQEQERDLLFGVFNVSTDRYQLLRYIEDEAEITSEQVLQLVRSEGFVRDRNRFSATFEWYVAELLIREFGAFSSAFGVRLEDIKRNVANRANVYC